jgi:hypothetical protein
MISRRSTLLRRSDEFERVPWEGPDGLGVAFIRKWGRPGGKYNPEHLTVYGKSGGGKSYFVTYVLDLRADVRGSHVCAVATKRADDTLSDLHWPVTDSLPLFSYKENRVIFWAKAKGISVEHLVPQRAKIKGLMDHLWTPKSNIIVYWDELTYLEQDLKLKRELATFYREGRTNGITNVASMQRPSGVTRLAHSEAGWTVAFPPKDADDRDRVAEVFGDRARFRVALDSLDRRKHEFLIRHDRTGEAYISHLPPPRRKVQAAKREVSAPIGYGVPSRRQGDPTPTTRGR